MGTGSLGAGWVGCFPLSLPYARTQENSYGEKSGWSNEAIADYCGFSDRSYFQKKFKESTGMTPTDYLTSISKK